MHETSSLHSHSVQNHPDVSPLSRLAHTLDMLSARASSTEPKTTTPTATSRATTNSAGRMLITMRIMMTSSLLKGLVRQARIIQSLDE